MHDSSTNLGRASDQNAPPAPAPHPVAARPVVPAAPLQAVPVANPVPVVAPVVAAPAATVVAPAAPAAPAAPKPVAAQPVAAPPVAAQPVGVQPAAVQTVAMSAPATATVAVTRPAVAPKPAAKAAPAKPAPRPAANAVVAQLPKEALDGGTRGLGTAGSLRQTVSSFLISTTVHLLVIGSLAFIAVPAETRQEIFSLIVQSEEPKEEPKIEPMEQMAQLKGLDSPPSDPTVLVGAQNDIALPGADSTITIDVNDLAPSAPGESGEFGGPLFGGNGKGVLAGRGKGGAKAALVKAYGGTQSSEAAVTSGLKWLAAHQRSDGSWSFDHTTDDCKGACSGAGTFKECYTGATGMALLAFLGAGHTHEQGSYQETVKKGINYLVANIQSTEDGGDLRGKVTANEGMYVQGIASIAVCEAHAMTKDRRLRRAAESVCNFVIRAQDPKGGGWRYSPRTPGDTSVVGWQVMALKSAQAAKIRIPPIVFQGANHFLDHVAVDKGAQYGYDAPEQPNRPATTAVGLLCRMYLGWKRDNPALERGVKFLSATGPSPQDMYYNYYATQVMHHWGGEEWEKWNAVMRDMLVKRQSLEGHAAGSWPVSGGHTGAGGRLLETCLSVMTLEVYYRHLPIYDRKKIQVEF